MTRAKLGKNYFFCASVCGFLHCVENTEVGVLMYVFSLRLATIAPCHSVSLMYGSALGCNVTLCHLVSLIFSCALGCDVICCMVLHFDLLQLLHVTLCL